MPDTATLIPVQRHEHTVEGLRQLADAAKEMPSAIHDHATAMHQYAAAVDHLADTIAYFAPIALGILFALVLVQGVNAILRWRGK